MTTASAPLSRHLPVRPEWLDKRREDILEPELPIIDPHHHLWDRPHNRYLFPELLGDVGSGHNIRATVFLECREMYRAEGPPELRSLGETEFVVGTAAMSASGKYGPTRCCAGIVGNVDLRIGDRARNVLERHVVASGGRFRGIRNGSTWHDDPALRVFNSGAPQGLLLDRAWREGFACLAPLDLSYDAWMFHTQIDELIDLARAFPETRIVLNHVGGVLGVGPYDGKRDEVFAAWSGRIRALAACRNVHVKLGGLAMKLSGFDFAERDTPPSSTELAEAWRPYFDTCIAAFGPERSMFESNFPVDKGMCSYPVLWNAFKRLATHYSSDEKTAMFSGTALRFYRLW
jgi:predicted TIM-barrel fold metal-dependent hydrolase